MCFIEKWEEVEASTRILPGIQMNMDYMPSAFSIQGHTNLHHYMIYINIQMIISCKTNTNGNNLENYEDININHNITPEF